MSFSSLWLIITSSNIVWEAKGHTSHFRIYRILHMGIWAHTKYSTCTSEVLKADPAPIRLIDCTRRSQALRYSFSLWILKVYNLYVKYYSRNTLVTCYMYTCLRCPQPPTPAWHYTHTHTHTQAIVMSKKSSASFSRPMASQYEYEEDDDDDSCGFICFALGVIFLFVGVAILATVIVYSQSPEDHSSVVSLTSTREVKPVSDFLMATIDKPHTIGTVDHCVNSTTEIPSPLSLLILVHSKPESIEERNAIRQTWMKDAHETLSQNKILVRFTIPGLGVSSSQLNNLNQESTKFKDMAVLTESSDQPESETLLFEMIWSTQKHKYQYLMKTTDSMYIRISKLNSQVLQELVSKQLNAYLGYFEGNGDPKKNDRRPEPDWFLCDHFIRYAHSGGYILSRVLVDRLLAQAKFLHPYNNQDIAVGTWLSPFKDIDLVHNIYFDTEIGKPRGCNNDLIVFQPANEEVSVVHKRLAATGHCCETEFHNIRPYSYDFFKLPSKCCTEL